MRSAFLIIAIAACGGDHRQVDELDAAVDPDPLSLTTAPASGSLDDLHEQIIAKRCSGQPGLCHNGQFEPNLSTPALTYAYVVNRPGIEKEDRVRVKPGSAAQSLFIDKIRNRNGVSTLMPLGAEPLQEADIKLLEAWIDAGALRAPGAAPPVALNNPPRRPQIGIFNSSGTRLDGTGPVMVAANDTLVLRHTVHDFETPDSSMPFGAVILSVGDGINIVLDPAGESPQVGQTTYDPAGPPSAGDIFNYQRSWTIPATLSLRDDATGAITTAPASGMTVTVLAVYVDGATPPIVALDAGATTIQIQ